MAETEKSEIKKAKERFAQFLERNPYSSIQTQADEQETLIIASPWGEKEIDILIPADDKLSEALNNVLLPKRFKAIWHADTKQLEVIFTAFPLGAEYKDVITRTFSFSFRKVEYECAFAKASDRLLKIAEHTDKVGIGYPDSRNLWTFRNFVRAENGADDAIKLPNAFPLCFWINGFEWDEGNAVELAMHLNFFMTYYDRTNPTIDIHPPQHEPSAMQRRERYVTGFFPKKIIARDLNTNLLHFWKCTRENDPLRRFLYAYQIIEHASFYYVEERVKKSLHKALSSPHIHHEIEKLIVDIMDQVSATKNWEGNKMRDLLREAVEPKLLWREIERNRAYFCADKEFEGGFRLGSWIANQSSYETWSKNWQDTFTNRLRDIRNSISHGKEQSTSGVILPTSANFSTILPWLDLAVIAAGEVMLYRHTTI